MKPIKSKVYNCVMPLWTDSLNYCESIVSDSVWMYLDNNLWIRVDPVIRSISNHFYQPLQTL